MECSREGCTEEALCRLVLLLYADPVFSPASTMSDFAMCREHGRELRDNLEPLLDSFDWDSLQQDFKDQGFAPPIKSLTKARLEYFE